MDAEQTSLKLETRLYAGERRDRQVTESTSCSKVAGHVYRRTK